MREHLLGFVLSVSDSVHRREEQECRLILRVYSSTLLLRFWPYMARRRGSSPSSHSPQRSERASAPSISPLDDTYLIRACQNFSSLRFSHQYKCFFPLSLFIF